MKLFVAIKNKLNYTHPVPFKEQTCVYAKNQKEYLPLPAFREKDGRVICCWKIGFFNKVKLLFTGKIWASLWTFNNPLQPLAIMTDKPFEKVKK